MREALRHRTILAPSAGWRPRSARFQPALICVRSLSAAVSDRVGPGWHARPRSGIAPEPRMQLVGAQPR